VVGFYDNVMNQLYNGTVTSIDLVNKNIVLAVPNWVGGTSVTLTWAQADNNSMLPITIGT
jgi:hypothetical protein